MCTGIFHFESERDWGRLCKMTPVRIQWSLSQSLLSNLILGTSSESVPTDWEEGNLHDRANSTW